MAGNLGANVYLQQALADAEHKVRSTARNVAAQAGYGAEHALMRFDAPDEKTGKQWLGFF